MSLATLLQSPPRPPRRTVSADERIRREAVVSYWRQGGRSALEVSRAFGVAERTLFRWADFLRASGPAPY